MGASPVHYAPPPGVGTLVLESACYAPLVAECSRCGGGGVVAEGSREVVARAAGDAGIWIALGLPVAREDHAEAVGRFALAVRYQAEIQNIDTLTSDRVLVETSEESFTTRMLVEVATPDYRPPEFTFEQSVADTSFFFHISVGPEVGPAELSSVVGFVR